MNNLQLSMSNLIRLSLFFLFFILCSLFIVAKASAQYVSYPISQLGNCRDGQECYLYCQIPSHTPACWSYGKYVLPQVLGEQTSSLEDEAKAANITFPIPELGNCQTALACFTYCSQAKNQSACRDFARKNGLAKPEEEEDEEEKVTPEIIQSAQEELGCTSRASCQTICSQSENYEKCHTFAKKHKLAKENEEKGPPAEVIEAAQTELGCTDQLSCSNFCQNKQNREKCYEFAKKHRLIDEEEEKTKWEQEQEKRQKLMEEAKETLGCTSFDECKVYCSAPEHNAACREFSKKHSADSQPTPTNKPSLPCENEQECRAYCEKRPEECKGFNIESLRKSESTTRNGISKQPEISTGVRSTEKKDTTGNFLGPGGCKSEGECKSYCEKHPAECPGFPKVSPATKPTTTAKKSVNSSSAEKISAYPSRVYISPTIRTESDPKKILYNLGPSTGSTAQTTNGQSTSSGPSSSGGGFGTTAEDK